jgi:flagellin
VNVLDASFTNNTTAGKFTFQVGANADQTIDHTINVFGLGTADGSGTSAITAATIASTGTPTTAQVSTLTLAETYAAGDVITVNLNENMFRYTVTATANSAAVDDLLVSALNAKFGDEFTATVSGGGVIKFELDTNAGTTAGNTFSLSASASDGEWDDIADLEVSTQSNSNTAITTLDVALTSVNKARAELGSVINRLTYAADNLSNVSQNTSASRSRVMDTDYAKATTELAKSQIIQQAATAMLAQANQQPSAVLSLLQ